jgi:hypothetical protein
MARSKMKPEKEDSTLINRSLTLTRDADETLQRLSGEASDYIGRKVSESAVMRALLRQAEQQKHEWVTAQLCPLIEEELASGVMWGKKK